MRKTGFGFAFSLRFLSNREQRSSTTKYNKMMMMCYLFTFLPVTTTRRNTKGSIGNIHRYLIRNIKSFACNVWPTCMQVAMLNVLQLISDSFLSLLNNYCELRIVSLCSLKTNLANLGLIKFEVKSHPHKDSKLQLKYVLLFYRVAHWHTVTVGPVGRVYIR